MTYKEYQEQCRALGFNPTMTEKQWCEMKGIIPSETVRHNKDAIPIEATHENYMEVEDV